MPTTATEPRRPIVLWGAAGHAKVLGEFLSVVGFDCVAVFDNDPAIEVSPLPGVPLLIGMAGFERWRSSWHGAQPAASIAIGGNRGGARLQIQTALAERGVDIVNLVHPRAYVATTAQLGRGSQVLVNALVGADARLGEACIVNTAASVDHECTLGDGVHMAPGARLAGCVSVGRDAFIGTGAVVLPRLNIGHAAIVGAGAIVTRDVPDRAVVYGNPARVIRYIED